MVRLDAEFLFICSKYLLELFYFLLDDITNNNEVDQNLLKMLQLQDSLIDEKKRKDQEWEEMGKNE